MVLGETCKMAATSADRRKLAVLGARRADWLCIGTSLDAQGSRGRVTAPGPDLSESRSRVLRGLNWPWLPRECGLPGGRHNLPSGALLERVPWRMPGGPVASQPR